MGILIYGGAQHHFDDRLLAHLKVVITAKSRRGESFLLSWISESGSNGTMSLWISPSIPLVYRFDDPEPIQLNRAWLEALADSALSSRGLIAMPEEQAKDHRRRE